MSDNKLPELPEPAEFVVTRQRMYGRPSGEFAEVSELAGHNYYTGAQLRAYGQACYEAGLNAGRHPACNCASGRGAEHCPEHAPTDVLPPIDGSLSKSTVKRVALLRDAEQRARELLADHFETKGGMQVTAGLLRSGHIDGVVSTRDALDAITRALSEGATAQPRHGTPDQIGLYQGPDDRPHLQVAGQSVAVFPAGSWADVCDSLESITGSKDAQGGAGIDQHKGGVPEGWVLVPREPTQAMLIAEDSAIPDEEREDDPFAWGRASWKAMLAAAPAASGEEGEGIGT